jgi:Zn-finger nucleic acid-binding protein
MVVFDMVDANAPESLFKTAGNTVDEQTLEAFALLGNETRLAILLALWEAMDPGPPPFEPPLSFSELRRQVGIRHGQQFNYHLERLVGWFVRQTDAGYTLTFSAKRILSTVMAGIFSDPPTFRDERIDAPCMLCGTSTVVDYSDGILVQRCPNCEGVNQEPGEPPGAIAKEYRPPVGLKNRTPKEFVQKGKTWQRHRRHAFIEGTCPDCSGTITTTVLVCDDHDSQDRTICEHCDRVHKIVARFVCDVCKSSMGTGVWNTILTEVPVIAFFHEHGLDVKALEDELAYGTLFDAVEDVTVHAEQPLEITVTVELDGDRLVVTVDEETRVLDVTEHTREPA